MGGEGQSSVLDCVYSMVDPGAECTLMLSSHEGTESIHISGVTGSSQELTVLEAKLNLTGKDWQKHPIVTGPEATCIVGIGYLSRVLQGPK